MAIQIASALFGKKVDENNWKVIDLMKRKKDDLADLVNLAEKAVASTLPDVDLNPDEIKVLESLVDSSSGNGHDFGFTDEYKECGFNKHQMAGYIGQLSKKEYLDLYDASDDPGVDGDYVQFVFTPKAETLLNKLGHDVYVCSNH